MTKILGVDPGLTKTGWGIVEISRGNLLKFVASGTIYSDAKLDLSSRLQHLHQNLTLAINLYKPDEASIEETFVNINPISSLKLGHARGSLMLSIGLCGILISEYSATAIKKAVVGVGRADKNQVARMVKILLPKADFKSDDESDALAAAICHIHSKKWN